MSKFWYDYVKSKYGEKANLCYMDMILKQMIFTKILWKMLKLDLILEIMNQIDHCLKEKGKKVIGLMKDELGGKIMAKFVGLRAKTYG